jgi:hypothetical protein
VCNRRSCTGARLACTVVKLNGHKRMSGPLQNGEWLAVLLLGQHTQTNKHHRRKGRVLAHPVTCVERGNPLVASLRVNCRAATTQSARVAEATMTVKDAGESEGRSVMDRIGDETIAPPRKRG